MILSKILKTNKNYKLKKNITKNQEKKLKLKLFK